ncbi:MAG: hypothetical protein V1798_09145, partial [Pseudomonadota bacterium]
FQVLQTQLSGIRVEAKGYQVALPGGLCSADFRRAAYFLPHSAILMHWFAYSAGAARDPKPRNWRPFAFDIFSFGGIGP